MKESGMIYEMKEIVKMTIQFTKTHSVLDTIKLHLGVMKKWILQYICPKI